MCLAKAYINEEKPENVCMENVMQIECKDGIVSLYDIFGRRTDIKGFPMYANFDHGKAIIKENN